MRVLITGCGAVGSVLAAALNGAGVPFVMAEESPEVLETVRENGLVLREDGVEKRINVDMISPREMEGPFDAVFLAVKGPRLGEAMRAASPRMHRDTFFISMQAGWPIGPLAEMVGPQRVVGGLVRFQAEVVSPGVVELVSPGGVVLGEPDGSVSPRLSELSGMLEGSRDGFLELTGNITGMLWSALRMSACLGSLGALAGSRLADGAVVEEVWDESVPLWEEIEDLARLEGVELLEEVLNPDPIALMRAARPYALSILSDLDLGESTEVEFTNGFVTARGKAHGAQTPVNNVLRSLVKELEKGSRAPGPANFIELRRRIREERSMGLM